MNLKKEISDHSVAIKASFEGKGTDYLPGNASMYEGIRCLLPNHYLDLEKRRAVRVPLNVPLLRKKDYKKCISESREFARTILKQYCKHVSFICPLTSGYDSRVVFSFFMRDNIDVRCFTFCHPGFTGDTPDLKIPESICRDYDQQYDIIDDADADTQYVDSILAIAGRHYSPISIHNATRFKQIFPGKSWLNAQIIDQIGKVSHVGTVPYHLANPDFFKSLHNNYSIEAENEIKKWIKEIKESSDFKNICDLFEWEIRCGKWASQAIMLFSLCGVDCLNIFNCRDLIIKWISIPRDIRIRKKIHEYILYENDSKLLKYPFNPRKFLSRATFFDIMAKNWVLRYAGFIYSNFMRRIKRG